MTFDRQERKPLLYADLFKVHKKTALETKHQLESGSSSSSSLNQLPSFADSSSSDFSTPFEFEFASSESEDSDFISVLTRQMTECMLQEDVAGEPDEKDENPILDDSEGIIRPMKNNKDRVNNNNLATASPVGRVTGTELAQLMLHKTEQPYMPYGVKHWGTGRGRKGQTWSGMQAVFLGGSGSKNGSSGTGVFLPRTTNHPSEQRKKSGCATVLIPTRVLQALEQHFNGRTSSASPQLKDRYKAPHQTYSKDEWSRSNGRRNEFHNPPTNYEDQEIMLPQEWSY